MPGKRSKIALFKELTWNDIQEWAGTTIVSRGRRYQRNRCVRELACTPSGGVVAWVQGTQRYVTGVDIEEDGLSSTCTCPYWSTCKHAVAVVLKYLEDLKQDVTVPTVTENDPRLMLLQEAVEETGAEGDEEDVEADRCVPLQDEKSAPEALSVYLKQQTKAQLIALLEELAGSYPAVHESLQDRRDLSVGTVRKLVNIARKEINRLSAEPGWSNHWNDEGYTPDYSRVRDRLEVLLARGHADEVVTLGEKLLEAGTRQVGMSHDEGETAEEISSCLNVVFRALPQSSLSPAEQMLRAVEAELSDDYDLCQGVEIFWEQEYTVADWNTLAEKLSQRLKQYKPAKGKDNFSRNYGRDRLSNRLIIALKNAGREEEIIPLCEREAKKTDSYIRLVNHLKEAEQWEEAEQWIHQGIKATRKQWPGIAGELRAALREMRKKEKDWLCVAAFRAEDFFQEPTLHTFQELQKAAEQAGVLPAVRTAAMDYLETGKLPQTVKRTAKGRTIPPWPLPETGVMKTTERQRIHPPMTETLIDIAIAEKHPGEVIRWYDRRKPRSINWGWGWSQDDRIAEAVVDTYPDRAVAIWKKTAEGQIARTQTKAYDVAAEYLRKIHHILQRLGREKEWQSYLAELRQANVRKRRLLEILDSLAGRRIVEG